MRLRAHHGLFLGFVAVVGILVAASVVIIGTGLRQQLVGSVQSDLARDLALARLLLEGGDGGFENPQALADRMRGAVDYRVTLVAPDGTVLADSDSDYRTMENHDGRPEVRGAFAGSTTFAERRSATVGDALLYGATELDLDGESVVLRLAASLADIDAAVAQTQRAVAGAGAVAILIALGLSYVLARALAHPLQRVAARARLIAAGAAGTQPLASSRMAELAELVEAFNSLTADLDERIRELAGERDEARDVLNAINEGVVALTADARLVRINEAAVRILEAEPVPALTHVSRFVRSSELRGLMEAAPSHAVGAREVRLGDNRYLVSGRPLGAGGAVVTFVDVSEIRRLEEVRSDFVANASHELKTPLTAVRGFSETLLEDDPPEELRQSFLDLIWRNTVRLQRLVEDLLDLSRLESGGWVPQSEHVRVEEIAVKAWVQTEPRVSESSVRLYVDGDGIAVADARGLSQIFQNLFDNALRHTPEGGEIRVRVETAESEAGRSDSAVGAHERDDDRVVVSVSDTGSGIAPVHLPRIFERFYRVDPARSRAEGGTGLGLAIVRHLVIAMGGEVWAESVIEEGTTVRFTLPPGSASSMSLMELDEEDDDEDDELDYGDFVSPASAMPN